MPFVGAVVAGRHGHMAIFLFFLLHADMHGDADIYFAASFLLITQPQF